MAVENYNEQMHFKATWEMVRWKPDLLLAKTADHD